MCAKFDGNWHISHVIHSSVQEKFFIFFPSNFSIHFYLTENEQRKKAQETDKYKFSFVKEKQKGTQHVFRLQKSVVFRKVLAKDCKENIKIIKVITVLYEFVISCISLLVFTSFQAKIFIGQ